MFFTTTTALVLTASFLSKLVPSWWTILDFAAARDDGGSRDESQNCMTRLHSSHHTTKIPVLNVSLAGSQLTVRAMLMLELVLVTTVDMCVCLWLSVCLSPDNSTVNQARATKRYRAVDLCYCTCSMLWDSKGQSIGSWNIKIGLNMQWMFA